ncbi:MAG TPA: F0F1 ATP synthase subunit B [Verrucomicrobiae bacterium]|nr:F0F1 ATP synthase subunit B [Verrucomicrobiae bacterium]
MKTLHRIIRTLLATLPFVALTGAVAWAEEAATALPPGEGSQIPPTDWGLQIWTLVTFVVLLVLLAKFAFKPIAQALDRRGETIKKSIEEAEKQRADAKKLMEDYQKQIADARNEAGKVIEEARQLGERVRKEVVEKANAEASAVAQRAQEEIVRQKEKGVQELKDTVASLSVQIASKVLEKEVNEATHRQLIDNLIKDLGKVQRS